MVERSSSGMKFFSENPSTSGANDDPVADSDESEVNSTQTSTMRHNMRSSKLVLRKLTKGRQKIPISFIHNKVRRSSTFSKRKTGLMKKAFELAELTGAEVLLLIASETNHVYTFTTNRLNAIIESEKGRELIQSCLSSGSSVESSAFAETSRQDVTPLTANGLEKSNASCQDTTPTTAQAQVCPPHTSESDPVEHLDLPECPVDWSTSLSALLPQTLSRPVSPTSQTEVSSNPVSFPDLSTSGVTDLAQPLTKVDSNLIYVLSKGKWFPLRHT